MDGSGSSNGRRERAAQIEQSNRGAQSENHEKRRIASPVDAPCRLKDLGRTGIDVRRTVENRAPLIGANTTRISKMMIPSGIGRTEMTKFAPLRWMRTGSKINASERNIR